MSHAISSLHYETRGVRFKLDADGYLNELDAKDRVVPPTKIYNGSGAFTARGLHAFDDADRFRVLVGGKGATVRCTRKVMIMRPEPREWVLDEPEFFGPFEVRAQWVDMTMDPHEPVRKLSLSFYIDGVQVMAVPHGLAEDAAHVYRADVHLLLPHGGSVLRCGAEELDVKIVRENWHVELDE